LHGKLTAVQREEWRVKSRFRRPARRLLLADLIILPLIMVVAFLWLAPIWNFADLYRHLWPVWAISAMVAVAVMAMLKRWSHLAVAAILTGLIFVAAVTELWRGQTGPDSLTFPNDPVVLRIATHNVWGQNFDPEHTIDVLQSLDAEVIGLQEAFGNSRGIESALLETHPFRARCDRHATRLVSRLEIVDSGCLEWRDTDWPDSRFALWRWEVPRTVWARIRLDNGSDVVVVATHMTWPNPLSVQNEQRRNLADLIARRGWDSVILIGDFNAAAPSVALDRIERETGLQRRTIGLPTWPSSRTVSRRFGVALPNLPGLVGIDHVFASEDWNTLDTETGPMTGSDHRPVIVTLIRSDTVD
jgi:endonuclease/exonuclease/phosphatase (EEP) superfamily protein YafD